MNETTIESTTIETTITETAAPKTITQALPEYLEYLKGQSKKESTINTIGRLLKHLVGHLGEQKQMGKILPAHIAGFFKSNRATKVKGRPMAEPTRLQIRRVTRQFLVWTNETGMIDKVPLPREEMKLVKPGLCNTRQGEQGTQSSSQDNQDNQGHQSDSGQENQDNQDNPSEQSGQEEQGVSQPEPEDTITVQENNTDSSPDSNDSRGESDDTVRDN